MGERTNARRAHNLRTNGSRARLTGGGLKMVVVTARAIARASRKR